MRTITNFFLANLAVADLCVGVFCVLPNLSRYLQPHWILGRVGMSSLMHSHLVLHNRLYSAIFWSELVHRVERGCVYSTRSEVMLCNVMLLLCYVLLF